MRCFTVQTLVIGLLGALVLAACGGGGGGGAAESPEILEVATPAVPLQAGQEIAYCYYFRIPAAADLFIKQWKAKSFAPGVRRVVLTLTSSDAKPPGTMSAVNCFFGGAEGTSWAFSANKSGAELNFPGNDGTGKPVGQLVLAQQPAYLWIHMLNSTADVINPRVEIQGTGYAPGTNVTRADSFVMYKLGVELPPNSTAAFEDTCPMPAADSKLVALTMHTNGLATKTSMKAMVDGSSATVFESTNWEDPGIKYFQAPRFLAPDNKRVLYRCEYANTTNRKVGTGDSPVNDEVCMSMAHYFPATRSRICYNDFLGQ
jgi:hypothetical protein